MAVLAVRSSCRFFLMIATCSSDRGFWLLTMLFTNANDMNQNVKVNYQNCYGKTPKYKENLCNLPLKPSLLFALNCDLETVWSFSKSTLGGTDSSAIFLNMKANTAEIKRT